jgi:hypothetical protein
MFVQLLLSEAVPLELAGSINHAGTVHDAGMIGEAVPPEAPNLVGVGVHDAMTQTARNRRIFFMIIAPESSACSRSGT